MGSSSPTFGVKIKKYLKPPPRPGYEGIINGLFLIFMKKGIPSLNNQDLMESKRPRAFLVAQLIELCYTSAYLCKYFLRT